MFSSHGTACAVERRQSRSANGRETTQRSRLRTQRQITTDAAWTQRSAAQTSTFSEFRFQKKSFKSKDNFLGHGLCHRQRGGGEEGQCVECEEALEDWHWQGGQWGLYYYHFLFLRARQMMISISSCVENKHLCEIPKVQKCQKWGSKKMSSFL